MVNKEPVWVTDARKSYVPEPGQISSETSFGRGQYTRNALRRYVLPNTAGAVNLLIVGAGLDAKQIYCPAEPYVISGYLENRRDYMLTDSPYESTSLFGSEYF